MSTDILARPLTIGSRIAPNRLVNHPMECNDADSMGNPTELTLKRYRRLARGGAGMITVESLSVSPRSRGRVNQLQAGERNAAGLAGLVKAIKEINPTSLVIIQLNHSGAISGDFSEKVAYYPTADRTARLLDDREMEEIQDQFVASALVAHKTGADGLDFKMCHGYLGGQLLRPANTRQGAFGGGFENRTRFFRETAERIREAVDDPSFLLGSRISLYEGIPGGFGTSGPEEVNEDLGEPLAFTRMIQQAGFHFISVSGGVPVMTGEFCRPTKLYPEGVYRQFGWAEQVKKAVDLVLIGSGYSYLRDGRNKLAGDDPEKKSLLYWARKNIEAGQVDLVGVGRQSLADPLFAAKVLEGRIEEIDFCTACGGCSVLLGSQARVGCTIYDEFYREELKKVRRAK